MPTRLVTSLFNSPPAPCSRPILYYLRMYKAGRRSLDCKGATILGRHVHENRIYAPSWLVLTGMTRNISALQGRPNIRGQFAQTEATHGAHRQLYRTETLTHPIHDPTIYALSTAPGRAAIAIVRISGPACMKIYAHLCPNKKPPKPRYAAVRSLYDKQGQVLDFEAVVLYFPAPRTVTGEDVLELHIHGGPAIVKVVLKAIGECNSTALPVRYAEPGEFTRRAFLNDRIDLTKVEALGDTLSAVTEEQRRLSVQGTVSGLATRYESWRQMLLAARGELEALIDFSEDQHFDESPAELAMSVAGQIRSLVTLIQYHCTNAVRGELLRNGISLSLIGSPNVGKSSLLNQIVGRNAAIVSAEAGTTRDVVEVGIDLGGFFCRLGDTAGLRGNSDTELAKAMNSVIGEVEKEGIKRAKQKAFESNVVILVFSIEANAVSPRPELQMEAEVVETAKQLLDAGKNIVVVVNKVDKLTESTGSQTTNDIIHMIKTTLPTIEASAIFCISCQDSTRTATTSDQDPGNMQAFTTGIIDVFRQITNPLSPQVNDENSAMWQESLGATERQRILLLECAGYLQAFLNQVDTSVKESELDMTREEADFDIVVAAESLRLAAECLAKLTGRGEAGDVEEVLGVVFEKFCVGK